MPKTPIWRPEHEGTLETVSITHSTEGEKIETWTATYPNVRAQELPPLRSHAKEVMESKQPVFIEEKSWRIRKEDRTIIPATMRFTLDGMYHYIYNVRAYMGTRDWLVIDTERRDNE